VLPSGAAEERQDKNLEYASLLGKSPGKVGQSMNFESILRGDSGSAL